MPILPGISGGRLTLTSGIPVTTSDVTGAGTLYYTPYLSDQISLYTSQWQVYSFAEISLALTLTSGKNYDVFAYLAGGSVALELSAAWTNDTTRADALTRLNGVLVKSADNSRRYIGTIRASGANVTEDSRGGVAAGGSQGKRFVWNMDNRVWRNMFVGDSTDSWTYASATYRASDNNANNSCAYVVGQSEDAIYVEAVSQVNVAGGNAGNAGIGVDSTGANSALLFFDLASTALTLPTMAKYDGFPGLGYHVITWLESARVGTATFAGDQGIPANTQAGMTLKLRN